MQVELYLGMILTSRNLNIIPKSYVPHIHERELDYLPSFSFTLQLILPRFMFAFGNHRPLFYNNNNNNNNYKTSIAPLSSKRIDLSGAPSTGVGQTHSPGTRQSSTTMIRWKGNLGKISKSEKVNFQMVTERNYPI